MMLWAAERLKAESKGSQLTRQGKRCRANETATLYTTCGDIVEYCYGWIEWKLLILYIYCRPQSS